MQRLFKSKLQHLSTSKTFRSYSTENCTTLLGLSISNSITGYAVLNYNCNPQKLGVIDIKNLARPIDKANEIIGVLSLLKRSREEANIRGGKLKHTKWIIGIEEYLRVPFYKQEAELINHANKIIGIVERDCDSLFKSQPIIVNPKEARKYLGGLFKEKLETRKDLNTLALEMHPNFPSIKDDKDKFSTSSYFLSDAWAVAHVSKRWHQINTLKKSKDFLDKMTKVIDKDKKVVDLRSTLKNTLDSATEKELSDVLKSRIEKVIDNQINILLKKKNHL